ncbi:MAG TPA: hypothetical protein PKC24_14595 [Cyclobacteriaceae bacterium]|nr:hypothetical protein [Cyclobacteriaceae bacterium]
MTDLLRKLRTTEFPFMPGSTEGGKIAALWIDESSSIQELKYAIGSTLIFKYRLRFFSSYAELAGTDANQQVILSNQDRALILKMIKKEELLHRKSA